MSGKGPRPPSSDGPPEPAALQGPGNRLPSPEIPLPQRPRRGWGKIPWRPGDCGSHGALLPSQDPPRASYTQGQASGVPVSTALTPFSPRTSCTLDPERRGGGQHALGAGEVRGARGLSPQSRCCPSEPAAPQTRAGGTGGQDALGAGRLGEGHGACLPSPDAPTQRQLHPRARQGVGGWGGKIAWGPGGCRGHGACLPPSPPASCSPDPGGGAGGHGTLGPGLQLTCGPPPPQGSRTRWPGGSSPTAASAGGNRT